MAPFFVPVRVADAPRREPAMAVTAVTAAGGHGPIVKTTAEID
jgi:hypothetical protein